MRKIYFSLFILSLFVAFSGCKRKEEKLANKEPDTIVTPESINLTGEDRLNSVVFLSWFGSDADGYVVGYELSLDNVNWEYTSKNDSVFNFTLEPGSDTTDIEFYVRAIDNEGLIDPTPAYLKVPLRNTAPVAFFDDVTFPSDSVNIVTTFKWNATDVDGDETIIQAFIKANEGDWLEIDVNTSLISLIPVTPDASGVTDADVYYNSNQVPLAEKLTGLKVNDTNTFYVKVVDFANAESEPDTSTTVFIKPKTSNTLLVTGLPQSETDVYKGALDQAINGYDVAEYALNSGQFQPAFWSPTFDYLLAHYETVMLVADQTVFSNSGTGRTSSMLDFVAPSIQTFSNNGGKSLTITQFTPGQDLSGIINTFPLDSVSSSNGQARMYQDSAVVSDNTNGNYPSMQATTVLSGLTPIYKTSDSEEIYRAQITPVSNWTGPRTVGVRRKDGNNNYYQYFFSIQLSNMDKDYVQLEVLFDQILNNDFNW